LSSKFHDLGFSAFKANTSLFFYNKARVSIYMLIYVHDIVVVSSSKSAVDALLHDLGMAFALKDLGELHCFLGIHVQKTSYHILLPDQKYAHDLLTRVNMQSCKVVDTPLPVPVKLYIHN
jgi:hypothetical protein